jgi:hypothetical protein
LLTGGWTELAEEAAAQADGSAKEPAGESSPAKTTLGPETSVLTADADAPPEATDAPAEVAPQKTRIAVESRPAPAKAAPDADTAARPAATPPVPRSPAEAPTLAIDPGLHVGIHRVQEVVAVLLGVEAHDARAEQPLEDLVTPRTDADALRVGPGDVPEGQDGGARQEPRGGRSAL